MHRRFRRDYFERRDAILFAQTAMVSVAAQSANARLDLKSALGLVEDRRSALAKTMFPYLELDERKDEQETYDELFDLLDEINARGAVAPAGSDGDGPVGPKV